MDVDVVSCQLFGGDSVNWSALADPKTNTMRLFVSAVISEPVTVRFKVEVALLRHAHDLNSINQSINPLHQDDDSTLHYS